MYTVALLAQKGGVGKTTLALSLAVQAELAGKRAGVLDVDPQASASGWYLTRKSNGAETPVVASATDLGLLRQAQADAQDDGLEWLFVDTAAGVSELPTEAAAMADLLLIPCLPAIFDMDAMAPTVRLARQSGKPAFFIVNRGRSKAINDECALALTSAYGLPAVNTHISTRLPIPDAAALGQVLPEFISKDQSVAKGKEEFSALWNWLQKQQAQGERAA
jgi:chromosome partitioning protein